MRHTSARNGGSSRATRQIQEGSAVGGAIASGMAPTALHSELEVVLAREMDRRAGISGGFTPNHGTGAPIVQPVPDLAGHFIVRIRRCNQGTAKTTPELVKG
jgi:hypothetical protein